MAVASPSLLLEVPVLHPRHGCILARHGRGPVHFMGGGPRTYPGGVSKWQWKRMQLKKAKQIEKARLMREKHVYEARRRAELLASSPALEMPWQRLSRVRPPNFVSADEQITKLAARFQRDGAEDLWTERDGPEAFESLEEGDPRGEYDDGDDDDGDAVNDGSNLRFSHHHGSAVLGKGPSNPHQSTGRSYHRRNEGTAPVKSHRQTPRTKPSSNPFTWNESSYRDE